MYHDYLTYNGDSHQYAKLYEAYKAKRDKFDEEHKEEVPGVPGVRVLSGADIANMPFPPSQVEVISDGYLLHVYGLYNSYPIEKIRSQRDLLAWLRCISEKRWFNGKLCLDFIEAVADQNKWNIPNYFD